MRDVMTITYLGLDRTKEQFKYSVEIGEFSFPYFTGIGWVSRKKEEGCERLSYEEQEFIESLEPKKYLARSTWNKPPLYRKKPSESDILECLYLDADCGSYSFNEFCDNLGYSNDSIKAFDIYRDCMEIAEKVRKLQNQGLIKRPESEE